MWHMFDGFVSTSQSNQQSPCSKHPHTHTGTPVPVIGASYAVLQQDLCTNSCSDTNAERLMVQAAQTHRTCSAAASYCTGPTKPLYQGDGGVILSAPVQPQLKPAHLHPSAHHHWKAVCDWTQSATCALKHASHLLLHRVDHLKAGQSSV